MGVKVKTSLHVDEEIVSAFNVRAAQDGISKGEALERAMQMYLGTEPPPNNRPKALREAHDTLDVLHANVDRFGTYWSIIQKILAAVRAEIS